MPKRIREQSPLKITLKDKVRQFENNQILDALNRYGWSARGKEAASRELGISLPSLYRKLLEIENASRDIRFEEPDADFDDGAKKKRRKRA